MDSPIATSSSSSATASVSGNDVPRAKFLCSFGGSTLPRPLDGRLRYVGGETRIVSLPRDVTYDGLLLRMRELFEGATVIKYQQPDEDLDALVSVVNDDDIVNMMEEYDKVATAAVTDGGGFTRLRIFLFTHHNPDPDAAAVAHFDVAERETERRYVDALNSLADSEIQDQFLGPGLHQLDIPHSHARYREDGPWNPEYFSPLLGRDLREFPTLPSSAKYNEAVESHFDQQSPPLVDNSSMWLPAGGIVQEKARFPMNLGHAHNGFDGGNSVCEHCRVGYQRYVDPRWNQPSGGNEYMGQFSGLCADCYRKREPPFYNESHGHDRGWHVQPHQGSNRVEDPRMHPEGRVGDHYIVDPCGHDDGRYHRLLAPMPVNEFGGEVFHGQQGVGHGNHHPSQFRGESQYQMLTNLPPIQNLRRRAPVPIWSGALYDPLGPMVGNGFVRNAHDSRPMVPPRIGVHDQVQGPLNGQNESLPQKFYGVDEHSARMNPNIVNLEERVIVAPEVNFGTRVQELEEDDRKVVKPNEVAKFSDSNANVGNESPECLTYLPELIASVKNVTLRSAKEVIDKVEANPQDKKEPSPNESGTENGQAELEAELDGDIEQKDNSKIEPITAEADTLAQGLQTIKNDDLEEIRQVGSGTYGSVYHGKWKGSDVAIKRIKASCFNGKPSERGCLIADFSKEA